MEICLNDSELLYLAGKYDAKGICGLPGTVFYQDPAASAARLREAEGTLSEKGLLELDFDGNAGLGRSVSEVMDIVFGCEAYFITDQRLPGGDHTHRIRYRSPKGFVCAAQKGQEYSFVSISRKEAADGILAGPDWEAMKNGSTELEAVFTKKEFSALPADGARAMLAGLHAAGLSAEAAMLVADTFAGNAAFCSYVFMDRTRPRHGLSSLVLAGDGRGVYEIFPERGADADLVRLAARNAGQLKDRVEDMISRFCGQEGGV